MVAELLEQDHQSLSELLQTLEQSLDRRRLKPGLLALDLFWARLAMHIRAEHLCLFPAILNASAESVPGGHLPQTKEVRAAIAGLRADHNFFMNTLAKAIAIMRGIAEPRASEAASLGIANVQRHIAAVKQRLEKHNRIEEEKVYRWASMFLTETELARLDEEMRRELRNLPPRFTGR